MKSKMLAIILVLVSLILLIKAFSANHNRALKKQFEDFISMPIHIPYDKLEKRVCYKFMDNYNGKSIRLVFYMDSVRCMDCHITKILSYAKFNRDICKDVSFVYLFPIKVNRMEALYRKLCDQRVEGEVYFDTCNAFRDANPMFPSNEVFHIFALDENNKVLFVGDPISKSKNGEIFRKIVAQQTKSAGTYGNK